MWAMRLYSNKQNRIRRYRDKTVAPTVGEKNEEVSMRDGCYTKQNSHALTDLACVIFD